MLFFVPVVIVIVTHKIGRICGAVCYACLRTARHVLPIIIIVSSIPRACVLKCHTYQASATERHISDVCYAVGNCHTRQAVARMKCEIFDACYAVTYRYAHQISAPKERRIPDTCYVIAYCHACQTGASIERIISDACYAVGYRHAF